jgi:phage tail-like protein
MPPPPPPPPPRGRAATPGGAAGAAPAGGGTALGTRADPFGVFQFKVDIGSANAASAIFGEVTGLEATMKYEDVKEGGQNGYVHRLPTRVEYGNLVLKRGYTTDNEFYQWCLSTLRGKISRRLVTVSLVSLQSGAPTTVYAWTFNDAYPVKWSGPHLKADDRQMAVETLELAHRGFQLG